MKTLVIGIGTLSRHDDAAGILIVRKLQKLHLPNVTILETDGEGALMMENWDGWNNVIVIGAVRSDRDPGTIYQLDASQQLIPSEFFNASLPHSFGVAEAIELSRALGRLPPHLLLYGIEGQDFSEGKGLSPEVAEAVPEVVMRVRQILVLEPAF